MKIPIYLYRIGHFFYKNKLRIPALFFTYLNKFLFGVWLPSSAIIGKNLTLGYWGIGTVIHNNTVLGINCLISQNVTIGRNFGDKNVPIIGNNVYIGAGSVIFGEIRIGNNVIIGANSLINKNIQSNTIVAGNPFKILKTQTTKKYFELDD